VNGETIVVDGGQLKGFWYYADDAPPVTEAQIAGAAAMEERA
jgi:hypothetical protein